MFGLRQQPRLLKLKLRSRIENILGLQLYPKHAHGLRPAVDIKRSGCDVSVIYDVGANIGQSAIEFVEAFPSSQIVCFEPISATFNQLKNNTKSLQNIECVQVALGASNQSSKMYVGEDSQTNSLVKTSASFSEECVTVKTLDSFFRTSGAPRIDILKIDAEGFDLQVLKGAEDLLNANLIAFVIVEAGFHRGQKQQILFDEFRDFLIEKGFSVFGIYGQQPEWSGKQRLHFANVCFCNENAYR